ncbi:MAG: hypothetical protein P8020_16080 [Acidobacteriota bacterium]
MSGNGDALSQAQKRMSEIRAELDLLKKENQTVSDQLVAEVRKVRDKAETAREKRVRAEDLKAEALYLHLCHSIPFEEMLTVEAPLDAFETAWREVRATLQPVRPSAQWLEKIREVEVECQQQPALSESERLELERRLKDNVCPICVSFALDGSCTLQAFETCPIEIYLSRLVGIVQQLGHRPWMEDYFERMYREICPGCQGRLDKDYCPPRDEGDCALYTYLPTVVRTIEDFLKERQARRSA